MMRRNPSPCLRCRKVADPENCENKDCPQWRAWFLERWEQIRAYPRAHMEQSVPAATGVPLGGRHYSHPHRVREYRQKDPCDGCICKGSMCTSPCPTKRAWQSRAEEVFL